MSRKRMVEAICSTPQSPNENPPKHLEVCTRDLAWQKHPDGAVHNLTQQISVLHQDLTLIASLLKGKFGSPQHRI